MVPTEHGVVYMQKEKEGILANAALYLEKSKEYRAHAAKQA